MSHDERVLQSGKKRGGVVRKVVKVAVVAAAVVAGAVAVAHVR